MYWLRPTTNRLRVNPSPSAASPRSTKDITTRMGWARVGREALVLSRYAGFVVSISQGLEGIS